MRLRNIFIAFIAAIMLPAYAGVAIGAITAEEAKKLGTTLTMVGAEKAGNRDGSIPEYTGGLTTIPPGFKKGSGLRPDPFAAEKPLFTITQQNMDKYADKLNDGQKTLFKKYPGYRMDIYKTHRTAAFPQYVLDNTLKQAMTTKTENDGLTLVGAQAAYPFPIPKTGFEAMWNHMVRYYGFSLMYSLRSWVVNAVGRPTMTYQVDETISVPYWDTKAENPTFILRLKDHCTGPPRNAGEGIISHDSLDMYKTGRRIWQYLPGQRRTKLAPDIAFDTPNTQLNGATTYDETFIYNGSMERFNFKLIGKKEMYVPYNSYKLVYHSKKDALLTPKHLNPDFVRWELHRVWVVQGDLKPGKRHIMSKRRFYLDEDTWAAIASEEYDARGQLYRSGFAYMVQNYDVVAPYSMTYGFYDFNSNMYTLDVHIAETGGVKYTPNLPEKEWLSESLAGSGIR
jgi:hypothetical protein